MPIYEYKCDQCKKTQEIFQSISDKKAPICCGKEMFDYFGNASINIDANDHEYFCQSLGQLIKGKAHRRELIKQHGLVEGTAKELSDQAEINKRRREANSYNKTKEKVKEVVWRQLHGY